MTKLTSQPMLVCLDSESSYDFWAITEMETTKQGSIVQAEEQTPRIDREPSQGGLPGLGDDKPVQRKRRPSIIHFDQESASLIDLFFRRTTARWSKATGGQYRWVLRDTLALAWHTAARPVTLTELLNDSTLLGNTLSSASNGAGSRDVCAWLTSQRRSVLSAFTELLAPELAGLGLVGAKQYLTRALRAVADPVGMGYRLPITTPRNRGGPTPSQAEIERICEKLEERPGWIGLRNKLLLLLMSRRGQRVNGLLMLDGTAAYRLPSGAVRFMLRAKSAKEPYELAVPADLCDLVEEYVDAFNSWARDAGLTERVGFGLAGRFWRGNRGQALSYQTWSKELTTACDQAGVARYTSHSLRRAFATIGTLVAPRAVVATAGNWSSTRRMDDHYVQRREPALMRHLEEFHRGVDTAPTPRTRLQMPVQHSFSGVT